MNEEINTISEEQVLHNKLSFEINQELIHLMKRIVELQQENTQLKDKIKDLEEWLKETRINSAFIDEQTIMEVQLKIQELEQGSDSNE